MLRRRRTSTTATGRRYATVALSVALVATLTGTGVAAPVTRLVTGKQVKDASLTTQDVRDRSLTRTDLAMGVVAAGVPGARGAAGAVGPAGPVAAAGPAGAAGRPGAPGDDAVRGATGGAGATGARGAATPFLDGPGGPF